MLPKVMMYTDGASRGNPGRGGYGTVLRYTGSDGVLYQRELSQGFRTTTNNRMEIMALVAGFEALTMPCEVTVYSDSQYVINAFTKHWLTSWQKKGWKNASKQPVKNRDLWERLIELTKPHTCKFVWVKGHAGHELNERCDELATQAADRGPHMEDTGFTT